MIIELSKADRYAITCALIAKARAHREEADAIESIGGDAGDAAALRHMAAKTYDLVSRVNGL